MYHEQLADCYYFGPDCRRDKPRPSEVEATTLKRDATYASQLQPVREAAASEGGFSFSKELSIYFQADKLPLAELEAFTHCFLIRSPEAVVRSFLRAAANGGETTCIPPPKNRRTLPSSPLLRSFVVGRLRCGRGGLRRA